MAKVWLILLILLPLKILASPFGFKEGTLNFFAEGSFLTTNKNYDDNGALYLLNPPNQLTETAIGFGGNYDLSSQWGGYIAANFKQVNAKGATYSNYSTSGLSDVTLGTDFLIYDAESFKLIPDLSLFIPLSGIPTYGTAFMNDGAFAVQGLLGMTSHIWLMNTSVYCGFRWRSEGLSSQIPLGALAKMNFGKSFFALVKAFGEISMANDIYSNSASTRHLLIAASNGGSFLYDSVNPSFFAVKASVGWNITKNWALAVGLRQTFIGYKVADESRFFVNLNFQTQTKKTMRFSPSSRHQRDEDDNFQVDTEGE